MENDNDNAITMSEKRPETTMRFKLRFKST